MRLLRNYTEYQVEQYLNKWLPDLDVCQCESCRLDIMAIMLNKLEPRYVVTEKGALFAQMDDFDYQHRVNFMSQMSEAVKVVKERPNH